MAFLLDFWGLLQETDGHLVHHQCDCLALHQLHQHDCLELLRLPQGSVWVWLVVHQWSNLLHWYLQNLHENQQGHHLIQCELSCGVWKSWSKFSYFEKATKIWPIFHSFLSLLCSVKTSGRLFSNFCGLFRKPKIEIPMDFQTLFNEVTLFCWYGFGWIWYEPTKFRHVFRKTTTIF